MSSPISSFSKLSISPRMQSSRGHHVRGHSGGKGKEKAPVQEQDASSSDEDSDEVHELEDLGTEEGIESVRLFALDHCRQHGTRYAFQIAYAEVERYSIRISTTDSGRPTCSCMEENPCRHVTWFLEQLTQTRKGAVQDVSVSPYEHIFQVGLDNLCEELQWELREGTDSPAETQWQLAKAYSVSEGGRKTRGALKERVSVVRDIMATLSGGDLETYRSDIFDSAEDLATEPVLVSRDLEATISKLLLIDDNVFHQFKTIATRDFRASEYFNKMGRKAMETLQLLNQYCQVGPVAGKHDLIWCAQTLVDIADAISHNVVERQPLSPATRSEAARSLVSILGTVVNDHNTDAYQYTKWPRRRPHGEPSIDRNLYERLIGSTAQANPAGGNFVIKALQDLPEAQHFVDELEAILEKLGSIGWGPAPHAYRDKLSGLIVQLKGSSRLSATPGKRPASTMDRKAKRMK